MKTNLQILALNNFDSLPDEMIEKILLFLRIHEALQLTEICKRFNEVFSASEKLLRKVRFDMSTEKSSRDFTEIPERFQSRNYKGLPRKNFQS